MSLREAAVKGMSVVAGLKVFSALSNQISNVFIALLLVPTDFGIFVIGFLFIQLMANFSDFGIGMEIVQRKNRVEDALYTGTLLRLVTAVVLLVFGVLFAPFVADFYQDDRVTNVMRVLSLVFLFHFLGFVPRVSLSRKLRFGRIVLPDVVGKVSKSYLAVALAFLGFSFWSLVLAAIVGHLIGVIGLYVACPWKLKLRFDGEIARDFLAYGKFVTSGALFVYLFHTLDSAIIGKVLGLSLLGSYVVAYTWGVYFPSSLNATISQVMFPIFSKMKEMKSRLRDAFLVTTKYSSIISAPVCFGVFALAPQFVILILGGVKWVDVVIPLRLLSFYGLHMVVTAPIEALYFAIGKPKQNFKFSIGRLVILLVPLYPAIVFYGLVGASIVVLLVGVIMTLWMFSAVSRELDFPVSRMVELVGPSVQSSALAAVLLILAKIFLGTSVLIFLLMMFSGALLYLFFMILLTRGEVITDIKEVFRMLRITRLESS